MNEIGKTGKFPKGKLNNNDEGELRFAIGVHKNRIIIDFNTPVSWIGFDKKQAIEIANSLLIKAKELK